MTAKNDTLGQNKTEGQAAEEFRAASVTYRKKTTRTKSNAMAALKRIGVLTTTGRLSSKYKG